METNQQQAPAAAVRSGVKTTEVWLSLTAGLVGAVIASGIVPADSVWERIAGLTLVVSENNS